MKRILTLLLIAAFIAAMTLQASAYVANIATDGASVGDVTGDGTTNNKDITTLFRYMSDTSVQVDEDAADVNGDGEINNKDVSLLFKYLTGNDITIADPAPAEPEKPKVAVTNSLIDEAKFTTAHNLYIKGWYGSDYSPLKMGYSINGGAVQFTKVAYQKDSSLDAYSFGTYSYRFTANIDTTGYAGNSVLTVRIHAIINGNTVSVLKNASGEYTVSITKPAFTSDAQRLIDQAVSWLGCNEADGSHKQIIDVYNNHSPLPQNYTVKYTDSWCATFVSACAIKTGLTGVVYKECGAHRQMQLFKDAGQFQGKNYTPKAGDIIYYDWDGGGWCDHVGIVVSVTGTTIKVIEGNKADSVSYRTISVGASDIYGYGVPAYAN